MPVDTSAKPPSPARRTATRKPSPAVVADPASSREQGLAGWAQIGSLAAVMRGWLADAMTIEMHAPGIIRETVRLADTNEQIARGVDYLCATGPYTALIAVAIPMIMQFGVNHNRIPESAAGMGGILPPDVLETQMRQKLELIRLQAAKNAEEARREAERIRGELNGAA